MKNNLVFIILVNYKTPFLTLECIQSIKNSTYKNYRIIVVDNGSNDDSMMILSQVKDIVLIDSGNNLGFSGGNNLGISYALKNEADYIMLLNNDTVIDEKLIEILLDNVKEGIVTIPKIYYFPLENKKLWSAGGRLVKLGTDSIQYGWNERDNRIFNHKKFVDFCCGCCFLISKEDLKKVGLLREEYFLYCEDNDYSLRMKKEGIKICYVPEAFLWHKVSASSGGENTKFIAYYVTRNRLYCAVKNKLGLFAIVLVIFESFAKYIKSLFKKNKSYNIALIALLDAYRGKMGKTDRDLS